MKVTTVNFEDQGQDFLEWDLDENNVVIGCRPFQASVWVGVRVIDDPVPGIYLWFLSDKVKRPLVLKYKVVAISQKEEAA